MSSSGALPMTCLKATCKPCSIAKRSCSGAPPAAWAATAVKGPKALPLVSFCRKAADAFSKLAKSDTINAAEASAWKALATGSSRPSTASLFNAPGTCPLRKLSCAKSPKKGQPDCTMATHGTSRSRVSTGDASCSKPVKSCTKAAGSSMVENDNSCKHSLPKPHSSMASGPKAFCDVRSLMAPSMAAVMASLLASIGRALPGAKRERNCCLAVPQAGALMLEVHDKSSGGSLTAC
mmetsp:Transcript_26888/g.61281  ORF Transcript_26888/g.61281 Transcript_26888/m.61281 type:complete len:236 (-) Transcript_26888:172-879(-)